MMTTAPTKREELVEITAQLVELSDKYAKEAPTDDQVADYERLEARQRDLAKEVQSSSRFGDAASRLRGEQDQWRTPQNRPPHADSPLGPRERRKAVGDRFVEFDAWKDWHATHAPSGVIPESVSRISSPPMHIGSMAEIFKPYSALLTGASVTSGGALILPDQYPEVTELGRRPLVIRDSITVLRTGSDSVEYVRITSETNNAATVAEATAVAGGSGTKPESGLAMERVTTPVKTIAHWIPATRRALADAAQLRSLINAFLEYGLDEELEDQIVNGNTVGEDFTGVANTTGVQSQAWDTDLFTTLRKARTLVRTVGRRTPTAYWLNPLDVERIDLLQDNEARYYYGGPLAGDGVQRVWRLPVVESEAVPSGVGYVGDMRTCVLWDREQASISVSDSHADFFIRNMIAILAELRAAFGILKPNAIVEIDLTA